MTNINIPENLSNTRSLNSTNNDILTNIHQSSITDDKNTGKISQDNIPNIQTSKK